MTCAYCGRPLCEDFVTGVLMTGDSDMTCRESPDQAHHLVRVTVGRHYLTRLLLERIPAPVERLLFLKCPRCGHRTWNCHGAEHVGYQAHYMIHLIDDLEE